MSFWISIWQNISTNITIGAYPSIACIDPQSYHPFPESVNWQIPNLVLTPFSTSLWALFALSSSTTRVTLVNSLGPGHWRWHSQANKAHKLVQEDINILKSALDIESCLTFTPNLIRHKNQISNKVISNRLKSHGFQVKWEYVKIFMLAGCLYLKLNVSNDRANTVKQLFRSCWSATEIYFRPNIEKIKCDHCEKRSTPSGMIKHKKDKHSEHVELQGAICADNFQTKNTLTNTTPRSILLTQLHS